VDMSKAAKDYHPQGTGGLTRDPKGKGTYSATGIWGDATLATRWAEPATRLLWFALLRCGQVLLERRRSPEPLVVSGVYTLGKVLSFIATAPVGAGELRQYYAEVRTGDQPLDLSVLNRRYLGSVPLRRRVKR